MDVTLGDIVLADCDVEILLERYTRRDYKPEREGDDMRDVGRKSYEFVIHGNIPMDEFKRLNIEANKKNNKFTFELGEFVVVVKRLEYRTDGSFELQLIEDVAPEYPC